MASTSFPTRLPHKFTQVYANSGGAGKPIQIQQRFDEVRDQCSALLRDGTTHVTDLFGMKIFFTLEEWYPRIWKPHCAILYTSSSPKTGTLSTLHVLSICLAELSANVAHRCTTAPKLTIPFTTSRKESHGQRSGSLGLY
jgi:hypothetical protein